MPELLPLRESRTTDSSGVGAPRLLASAVCEHTADIALLGGVGARAVYTYRIPTRLVGTVCVGHLVKAYFGPRVLQGIVISVAYGDPGIAQLRDIVELLDPIPCLTPAQIDLMLWMADYYACALADVLNAVLPSGLDRATITSYTLNVSVDDIANERLSSRSRAMLAVVAEHGSVTAAQLARIGDAKKVVASLDRLAARGLISKQTSLGRTAVVEHTDLIVELLPRVIHPRATRVQERTLNYLEDCGGEALWSDMRRDLGVSTAVLHQLVALKLARTVTKHIRRDPLAHRDIPVTTPPRFTPQQNRVYQPIGEALASRDGAIFLLHGITGSGKTEVYLKAVEDTLRAGRGAIVLVPEIGLTPQAVARFAGRFPGKVALLHSRLSAGERYDEWQRIRSGECSVVVGARSALFSPFANLGLIVIDEEHDASYKQDSPNPRYHARETAIRLARSTGAVVILGSATPDVVSFHRAATGEFKLLVMNTRARGKSLDTSALDGAPRPSLMLPPSRVTENSIVYPPTDAGLPFVQIVDMRLELKSGNRSIFSRALASGLARTLERGEQAILFLNRRGNATFVNCRDCGRVEKCPHCDLPLTYHSHGERLQCHRCDARLPIPTICLTCGSWRIRYFGLGTQKVEQEVLAGFPNARVHRYDRDSTLGKTGHETILDRFSRGEIDILIGTQLVAKGLDFPKVTLVGAVSADTSLNMPDFRAAERTFSILTQVAGRAGRAELPGMVVVQSYSPKHFAILAAGSHDYAAFYRAEIQARQDGLYPPFYRLARLVYSDRLYEGAMAHAGALAGSLRRWLVANPTEEIDIIGPAPCFISRLNDRYYWQILLRGQDPHSILREVPKGWTVDVDPMNML